ncbi:Pentatricopeptide repeat-containing protein [Thalictrum thalictroides]|uniref:Pentatricopeptide repeat-containing protein n=1 Tax=Thalictrum thalictroides TaxID=46969 RepID=A0A7J6UWV4_THATH|nr:Pentatricopeptide repeat-containing protein [Thalictrum thalictroides]
MTLSREESESKSLIDSIHSSLQTFTNQDDLSNAFKDFSLIQYYAISSNSLFILHPISSLLLCCTNLKSLSHGKQLHTHIIKLGFEQSLVLVPKLITFYSTFGHLGDAHIITENSNVVHSLPWNLLISAYVKNGLSGKAIFAYKQMVGMGIRPDNFTYPSVLKACGDELELEFGMEIHRSIETRVDLDWCLFVHNALLAMYGKCGRVDIARRLFDNMPERDIISWNSIITGYASKSMWKEAFELFERLRLANVQLNIITWNTIAGGYVQTGNCKGALGLISQMKYRGAYVDPVAIVIGLAACSRIGSFKVGREIHGYAIRSHYDLVDSVRNALITMYARCLDLRRSYFLFRSTETKNLVTWNSMIGGYAQFDQYEEASFIFREMVASGFEPNYVTIASILPLCARVANLQHGKELHCYIVKRGEFQEYLLPWNSLVDMYSKSGKISEARGLFNSMKEKDEVTYTSLIAGLGMQGEGHAAIELFEEMNKRGVKPDHIAMVAVLSACSHSGLVSEGEMLFEKMINVYKINHRMEHFACMADLFGRAGLLRRAVKLITEMPFSASPAMWATLIGACRIHGNTDIGEWAAEKLLEMKPENSGYYVLIANMYAAAGCWSKLAYVRKLMRDFGVRKAPGCTWIDVGNGFHPFVVGDTTNTYVLEIYQLLHGLSKHMNEAGYIACYDLMFGDESFEEYTA